jgi:hypothetical protein
MSQQHSAAGCSTSGRQSITEYIMTRWSMQHALLPPCGELVIGHVVDLEVGK